MNEDRVVVKRSDVGPLDESDHETRDALATTLKVTYLAAPYLETEQIPSLSLVGISVTAALFCDETRGE